MILSYGNVNIAFAISSSGGGAAFLTSSALMNDAKSGIVTSCKWDTGSQSTSTHVDITCTLTSPLDATCAIGAVGLVNVQGLPAGIKAVVNGVSQVLVPGARGELSAWWIPQINSNSLVISIYNDAGGGSHPITAGATFGIGEIFVGRVTTIPSLVQAGARPAAGLKDRNAYNASAGAQLYALMRTPGRTIVHALGYKSTSDVAGGASSTVQSGGNPAGVIDIKSLRDYLSTSQLMAVCDFPSKGGAALVGGLRYDQNFMQPNWMIARMMACPDVQMDQSPFWSWTPGFEEAR